MPEDASPVSAAEKHTVPIGKDIRIKDYTIASSINGVAIGDLNGVVTYVNAAALKMWGGEDPSDIIGKSATVFAQSEPEALRIMHTILEKGEWSGEIAGWRKNGDPITVLMSASLVRDENEEPLSMICSFIDITDRKRMEEELRVKDSAIASSINGIAIGDLAGHVTYVNQAALKMWGTDNPGDILGKPVTVFAQSEEEALRIMQVVLEKGQWSGEIMGRIMDGSPIAVHVSASLVRNEKGEPICLMCSFIDVSERKRIENELRIMGSAIASSLNG
ncbi:MAG TPA: PAS domain-containing protein, partial [Deltaproteobacteria bacterium]|nr:PAS domain-containing protein [Deltaproteobacteria bacterium]